MSDSALSELIALNAAAGSLTETAPATDVASSGLNGRAQRIAQRITSLIGILSKTTAMAATLGAVTKANAKSSAGTVYAVYASNVNAAVRYLLLHNKATAPVATDVPLYAFLIPAGGNVVLDEGFFGTAGIPLATGIGWSVSTTLATFTDSATAAEHAVHIHYV